MELDAASKSNLRNRYLMLWHEAREAEIDVIASLFDMRDQWTPDGYIDNAHWARVHGAHVDDYDIFHDAVSVDVRLTFAWWNEDGEAFGWTVISFAMDDWDMRVKWGRMQDLRNERARLWDKLKAYGLIRKGEFPDWYDDEEEVS